jgi:hypothetical protein
LHDALFQEVTNSPAHPKNHLQKSATFNWLYTGAIFNPFLQVSWGIKPEEDDLYGIIAQVKEGIYG